MRHVVALANELAAGRAGVGAGPLRGRGGGEGRRVAGVGVGETRAGVVAYPRRARALRAAALVPAQPGLAFPSLLLRADRTCGNSAHARNRVGIICAWPHQDVQILRRAAHVQVCAYTFKVCLFAPRHDRDLKLSKSHRVVAQARELVWRVLARYARTRNLEKMIIISFGATWLSRKASQGGRPVARVVSDGGATARNAGAEKAVGRGVHGLGKRAALAPETRMSVVAIIRRRTVSAWQRLLYAIAGVVAYPRRARALRAAALVPAQPGLAFPSLLPRADRTCGNSAHARNRVGIICAWPHQDVQILRRAAHVQVCAYTFKVCLFAPRHDRDLKLSKSHRVVAQARELVWRVLARYARTRNLEKMIIISFGATWLSRKASQGGRPVARVVSDGGATARNAGAEKAVGRGVHGLGKRAALAPETRMSVVAVIRRRTVSAWQRLLYAIAGVVAYPRRARALRAAALVPAQPGLAFPSLLPRADRTCGVRSRTKSRWNHLRLAPPRCADTQKSCTCPSLRIYLQGMSLCPRHDRDLKLSKSHRVVAQARELVWRVLARYARTRNLEKMIIISFGATWLSRKASQGGRPVARVVSDGGATARNAGAEKAVGRGVHGLGKRAALAPETRMSVVAIIRRRTVSARQRRLRRDTLNQTNEGNGEEHLSDEALASVHFDWPRLVCMVQRAYKRVYATGCFLAARAFFLRNCDALRSTLVGAPRANTSLAEARCASRVYFLARGVRTRGTVAMGVAVPELKQCVPRPVFHSPSRVVARRAVASVRPPFPAPPVSRVPPLTSASPLPPQVHGQEAPAEAERQPWRDRRPPRLRSVPQSRPRRGGQRHRHLGQGAPWHGGDSRQLRHRDGGAGAHPRARALSRAFVHGVRAPPSVGARRGARRSVSHPSSTHCRSNRPSHTRDRAHST